VLLVLSKKEDGEEGEGGEGWGGKGEDGGRRGRRALSVVCDMAHWQLSPGEQAHRRARWRCSKGDQPFPYGREARPCYPLIPADVWC
jgi:hypothetical protein